ncbi:hypothetical protein HK096_000520, partial [Nowakowskiella sp. JEL0078]
HPFGVHLFFPSLVEYLFVQQLLAHSEFLVQRLHSPNRLLPVVEATFVVDVDTDDFLVEVVVLTFLVVVVAAPPEQLTWVQEIVNSPTDRALDSDPTSFDIAPIEASISPLAQDGHSSMT